MTTETDKQFVERMIAETPVLHSLNTERLLALALRGAETQWRPIEEAPKDETWLLLSKWVGHTSHPTSLWWVVRGCWSLKWNKWWDGIEPCGLVPPTHFIPLTALGEPTPQPMEARRGELRTICDDCGNSNLANDRAVWTDDWASYCPTCRTITPQPMEKKT